jgi:hypothetical protein
MCDFQFLARAKLHDQTNSFDRSDPNQQLQYTQSSVMNLTDLRLDSFNDPAWPYSKRARKYKGLQQSLASAGFYFSPTTTHKDRCLCFLCGKSVSGMTAQDDLLALHSAANSTCPLVIIGEQVAGTSFGGI